MESVNELLTDIISGLHCPQLAHDLGILSCILFKRNNSHRRYKFYQVFKQVETNMEKFINLNIKHSAKTVLRKNPLKTKDWCANLSTLLYKGYVHLVHVRKLCMRAARLSLQQLSLFHFVDLHILFITLASTIYSKVGKLLTNVFSWYMHLRQIAEVGKISLPDLPERDDNLDLPKIRKLTKSDRMNINKFLQEEPVSNVVPSNEISSEANRVAIPPPSEGKEASEQTKAASFLSNINSLIAASRSSSHGKRKIDSDSGSMKKKQKVTSR